MLRVEAGLFFANADHVRNAIRAHARADGVKAVVLDAETVPDVDVTAAEMLEQLRGDLDRDGVKLLVARDIGQVRDVLRRAGAEEEAVVFPSVEDAGQPSPLIPSPISFAPMTRQSTAMIAVLLAPIHAFISSSRCVARSPSAK